MLYTIMLACHYHSDIKKITFRNCILKCQKTRAHGPLHAHLRNIVNYVHPMNNSLQCTTC